MKTPMKAMLLLAGLTLSPAAAASAEKCYQTLPPTYKLTCNASGSNSADFSTGCHFDNQPKQVEIPCTPPGRWVNIYDKPFTPAEQPRWEVGQPHISWAPYVPIMPDRHPTREEVCAKAGLIPASHEGMICASGRMRPTTGEGWSSINYVYGIEGGNRGGGSRFTVDWGKMAKKDLGYCHTGSYKEFEKYMAVAFYCSR